jgi:hypothetical protein
MRLPLGYLARFIGIMFLSNSTVSAQMVVQPKQPPMDGTAFSKQLIEHYEKLAQDPAYDVGELKNARGALILRLVNTGPYEKVIDICEKELARFKERGLYGEQSSTWLITDLGRLYSRAGQHDKAIALSRGYADWCAKQFGAKSPDTIMARGGLVRAYLEAKQDDKAMAIYNDIFAEAKRPSVEQLRLLDVIHQHYFTSKQYEKQLDIVLQIMEIQTAMRDPRADPGNMPMRTNTAYTFIQAGKKDLAEKLIDHEWIKSRKANGADDPRTLAALRASAADYFALQQSDRAIARFGELVELLTKKSGADHVDTLTARNHLAQAHLSGKETEKARKMFQELYPTVKEKLGIEHPLTGQVLSNLSGCLETAGKFGDAEPHLREYLDIQKKVTKANDTPTVTSGMAMLGTNLLKQEKWAEAEKVLSEALEIRRKKEPQLWTTNNTESLLGAAFLGQKKYKEAEPLLLAGYKGLSQKRYFIPLAVQAQRVNESVERLIKLYEATEQPARAEEYRKLLKK